MKKKWNLLFLFAFIVSMITLAGCGKTAGEASPYEGKWIAVSAQMIGMSVSVDETFGGAFEFEVKNGGKVSFSWALPSLHHLCLFHLFTVTFHTMKCIVIFVIAVIYFQSIIVIDRYGKRRIF